jgi:hypothetical protein
MEVDALKGLIAKKDAIEAWISSLDIRLIVFGAIVLVGIAGETWYGVRTWWSNRQLRLVQKQIDEERGRIDSEKDRQATAISDQLKLEIADANKATEELRNENLKLQEKLAPRSLTEEQQKNLLKILSAGPMGDVIVIPKAFDEESEAYADQITSVLKAAGFTIKDNPGQRPFSWGTTGVFMAVENMNHPPLHAAFIQGCFRKVGIELVGFAMPNLYDGKENRFEPSTVIIGIAAKPLVSLPSQNAVKPSTKISTMQATTNP